MIALYHYLLACAVEKNFYACKDFFIVLTNYPRIKLNPVIDNYYRLRYHERLAGLVSGQYI